MLFAQGLTAISPPQVISITFPAETCPKNSKKPCKSCYLKPWMDILVSLWQKIICVFELTGSCKICAKVKQLQIL